METYRSDSTSLRDYLRIIFRHKIIFVILPLAIMIPVYLSFEFKIQTYEATVKMYVKGKYVTATNTFLDYHSRSMMEEHAEFVKSNVVIERVVNSLKLYQIPLDYEQKFASRLQAALLEQGIEKLKQRVMEMPDEQSKDFLFKRAVNRLRSRIKSVPVQTYNFFTITVRDVDPQFASVLANSVSRSYVIFVMEQQILDQKLEFGEKHPTVVQLQDYINKLELTLSGEIIPDLEAIGPATVKIVQQAKDSYPSTTLNKNMILLMSFVSSIVLSIMYCFVIKIFDQSFRSSKDIENYLKIPFLGYIPKRKSGDSVLISNSNPGHTSYARTYQNFCDHLALLMRDKGLKSILVTGVERSMETAVIVANLSIYLAQKTGRNVLIIDADFRNSLISEIFKVPNSPGLTDVLEGNTSFLESVQVLGSNLNVISSGITSINPVNLLESTAMADLIKKVNEKYDMVFICSTGLMNFTDSVILSAIADGTAIVINEGKVRRQVVEIAISPLKQKNVNMIGAILNNHKYVIPEIIYKMT